MAKVIFLILDFITGTKNGVFWYSRQEEKHIKFQKTSHVEFKKNAGLFFSSEINLCKIMVKRSSIYSLNQIFNLDKPKLCFNFY